VQASKWCIGGIKSHKAVKRDLERQNFSDSNFFRDWLMELSHKTHHTHIHNNVDVASENST
jgi:hypothetical protein